MTYADQWTILSSRIHGLMEAAELHARFLGVRSSDSYGRAMRLNEQCVSVLSALLALGSSFQHSLPPTASACIDNFIQMHGGLITDNSGTADLREERAWAALVLLGAFETEMSFILSDVQAVIRARSERAFAHLQRMIVADLDFCGKWDRAFKEGEVACEKLGAVHLLSHGIFAFKVSGAGERTDLVFQNPISDLSDEQRYADGIVLTEWKIARSDAIATKQFEDARSQAQRYAQGVLSGSELAGYRYVVVVSGKQVRVPRDRSEDGIIYLHKNIAVDPMPPSRKG